MPDAFGTDLRVQIDASGGADLATAPRDTGQTDLLTVTGRDNLAQALTLRLMVELGELTALGHPRHGSRLQELIGEPMDQANLELARRYVRRALRSDPRVESVVSIAARQAPDGIAEVVAVVAPVGEPPLRLDLALEFG